MSASAHLRASLWCVAAFLAMGMWLEAMFGLRVEGVMNDPIRREFLRLGHAHGGLLALLNVALAWALLRLGTPEAWASRIRVAAWLGSLLVGVGFVGGGLVHGPTDPGPAVLLVPAGALMVVASLVATALLRAGDGDQKPGSAS
jgi:peptidoglycan/LPS O-acetylase OafA/YrhL